MQLTLQALLTCTFLMYSISAEAYVGPGLGTGTIGIILGILGSILIALVALFWYPLKRLIKKLKKSNKQDKTHK